MEFLEGYALAEASGIFDLSEGMDFISNVLKASKDKGFDKILIDGRKVKGINETIERYEMAKFISKITPVRSKIAFLVSENQILPDKFFENVAKNRMVNAFVTKIRIDSIKWLLNPP